MSKIDEILGRIAELEQELAQELRRTEDDILYTIHRKKVLFSEEIRKCHRELAARLSDYVYDSGMLIILTIPLIWGALIPAVILDVVVMAYQWACFPIYGIPRVKRSEYVVIDRHALSYLNVIEKLNCVYCGYFNGVMSYVREVAARTEQYWCPIRHARPVQSVHGRYKHFFAYGDAESYRRGLEGVRRKFDDVRGDRGAKPADRT
jgi:hypothetical protein